MKASDGMAETQVKDLLEAGVHFGHQSSRWNPKMKRYIFAARNGIHIIDLKKSAELLAEAQAAVREFILQGDRILFVCTKRQLRLVVDWTVDLLFGRDTSELARELFGVDVEHIDQLEIIRLELTGWHDEIAGKLKRKNALEKERKTLIAEGVLSIQAGLNPRVLEEKLKAYAGGHAPHPPKK